MADAEPPRCANCRYARPTSDQAVRSRDHVLECRRRAPVAWTRPLLDDQVAYGWFPVVSTHDWCGDFAPQNPETLPEGAPILVALALAGDLGAARALADKLRE